MQHDTAPNEAAESSRVYEAGLLLVPSIAVENVPAAFAEIKSFIEKAGGSIISEEVPALRTLAYSMSKAEAGRKTKFHTAYFGWVKFEGPIELAKSLDAELKESEKVLRYIVIKTVRENTLYYQKVASMKAEGVHASDEAGDEDAEVSEVEIDKGIEKLLV